MAASSQSRSRRGSSWFSSLLGAAVLIIGGFLLGLVVGIVKEEPKLVIGHLAGQSEEVRWSEQDPGVIGETDAFYESEVVDGALSLEVAAAPVVEVLGELPTPERSVELPPVSAPSPTTLNANGFAVQVGAFAEGSAAEHVATDLRDKGFAVYVVEPASNAENSRWRVRVGPLPTEEDAQRVATRLKIEERLPTWVLSEGGS